MARGSYINIRYLVEYVDEGTRPMLAADREIRKNVAQTSKVLADQGVVTADVAGEQVKLAQETVRVAGAQGELGAAARKAATSEARLGAASADAAVAAGRAAKAAAEAAAAYSREASAGTRVAGVTRQVNAAQSAAAASARRAAAAHDAAAVAVGRSANRFTAAGAAMQAHGKKAKETGHSLSGLLLPMALVAGGAGKLSVDFGRAMEQIHTQAGGSQREVDQLRGKVLELAKTLPQSPQELAGGLYHLESVGLRGAKAMDALKVAAEGAAVGNTDVESTATALGSAWLVNIKGAGDLHHVMGELNAAVGAGNVRMADLVDALGTGILPASKEAGLSLHDVLGALAVFTDEGYQASSAAAQFSTALHFLYNPTKAASQAFDAMGLKSTSLAQDLHKPQGLLVALRDLKAHLEEAGKHAGKPLAISDTKTLPATDPATRQEQLLGAILPGGRGRIMLTLLNQLDRYQMKLGQIQHTSSNFDEAIAKTHETASFRLHRAWATIQADAIQLGDALIPAVVPAFEEIAHILGDVAHDFSELPVPVRTAVVAFTLAGAALGPFLKIYGNLAIAGGAVAKGFGLARTALFGYTAAQKVAAAATKETVAAEAVQAEVAGGKGVSGFLGSRGGLLGIARSGIGRYSTAVAGTQIAETQATYALARGTGASRIGAGLASLGPAAGAALRTFAPVALGVSLVDGIVHGIESKRPDFGGKFLDFLHGATFGIIGAAGESTAQRIEREYVKAIDDGLKRAAQEVQHGAGFAALDRVLNMPHKIALTGGDVFGSNPRTTYAAFPQLAQRDRQLTSQIAAANRAQAGAGTNATSAGRGAVQSTAQLSDLRAELDRVRAAEQRFLKDVPKFANVFRQRGDYTSLVLMRRELAQTGQAGTAAFKAVTRAAELARGATFNALTRDLGRGAANSLKEVQDVMRQAQTSMRARGLKPGDPDFARAQEALARSAATNIRRLVRDHVITAQQGSKQIKSIYRDMQLSIGRSSTDAAKAGVKGLDDMVRGWRDDWAKAGKITDSSVKNIGDSLALMPSAARKNAAQAMVLMAQQLASQGKIPQRQVDRLVLLLQRRFGDLGNIDQPVKDPLKRIAQLLAALQGPADSAQHGLNSVKSAVRSLIPGSAVKDIAQLRGALSSLKSTADSIISTLQNVTSAAAGITTLTPADLGLGPKKHKRAGGYAYQAGGLVPIMAAGGELAVFPDGRSALIGGDPRSDSTPLAVPPMTAILTGHGQQLVANGYTIDEAIRAQMPHFKGGGRVFSGKVSTFGPPNEAAGTTATGVSSARPGIALYNQGTKNHWFDVRIGAHRATLKQTDIGPAPWTGRIIDVTGAGARQMGINPRGFPTDSHGTATEVGGPGAKGAGGGGGGGGGKGSGGGGTTSKTVLAISAMSAAEARKALPHLLTPLGGGAKAFNAGYQSGLEGTYGRALLSGSDLWDALKVPTRTVTVGGKGGGGGGQKIPALNPGGASVPKAVAGAYMVAKSIAAKHLPYKWGGGHGGFHDSGYDCSGYVSAILHGGGLLGSPVTTDGLKSYGSGGAGKWITIGVRGTTGRNAHTMIRLGNTYWESGGRGGGGGPHRDRGWDGGFSVWRHPRGLRAGGIVGGARLDPRKLKPWLQPELFDPHSARFVGWGYRRGGIARFAVGGTVSGLSSGQGVGSFTFDPTHPPRPPAPWIVYTGTGSGQGTGSTGLIDPRHGPPATGPWGILRELEAVGARANAEAKAAVLRLVQAVDGTRRMSIGHIEQLESRIRGEIRHLAKGGLTVAEQVKVRRLRGALSALETVIGGRVGNIVAKLDEARQALDEKRTRDVDQQLRILGRDPSSSFGENLTANFLTYQQKELNRELTKMRSAFAVAKRHHDTGAEKDIQDKIHQLSLDIRETAVQLIEAHRGAIIAAAQENVNAAQYQGDIHQAGYEALQLQQQLRGTDPSNVGDAQERANYITGTIVPDLQKEQATLLQQYHTLLQTSGADSEETRQAFLAYLAKGNEISQQQLDAQNQIKDATQQTADNTKDFGGSLGFESGGSQFTDLIRAGSGA